MGTNALTTASAGQEIPASHHNELVEAFLQNIVPRDASRVAVDLAGSLGTSALRWLRSYVETYHIGTASQNLTIHEGASGEIWLERNSSSDEVVKIRNGQIEHIIGGVVKFRITSSGIDWTTQATGSIPISKVAQPIPISAIAGFIFTSHVEVNVDVGGTTNLITLTSDALVVFELNPSGAASGSIYVDYGSVGASGWTVEQKLFETTSPFTGNYSSLSYPAVISSGKTIKAAAVGGSSGRVRGTLHVYYM